MMDEKFEKAWAFTHQAEGGLVDHPSDPGGITNHGVCLRTLRGWGYDIDGDGDVDADDIRALTPDKAKEIYYRQFWLPAKCGKLPVCTAVSVFDLAVNAGVKRAILTLQRACNINPGTQLAEDGVIGEKTLARVSEICLAPIDDRNLSRSVILLRSRFYDNLAARNEKLSVFLNGWQNRCARLRKYVSEMP